MCGRLNAYLLSFTGVRGKKDKSQWKRSSHYRSPEKPLLLLAILHHIAEGHLLRNFISPTTDLQKTYSELLILLSEQYEEYDVAIPLFELKKTTFWELSLKPGCKNIKKVEGIEEFSSIYFGAKFSNDLFILLQMEHSRRKLMKSLLQAHFDEETAKCLQVKLDELD